MKFKDNGGREIEFMIHEIDAGRVPLKKDGWNFNWRELTKKKNRMFFGLFVSNEIQGIISIEVQLIGSAMMFMHQIELAPHNIGVKGKYKEAAGCLLAYACYQSLLKLEVENPYFGYLVFESKTNLIQHYKKYGATSSMGTKMYFSPEAGNKLIERYLKELIK